MDDARAGQAGLIAGFALAAAAAPATMAVAGEPVVAVDIAGGRLDQAINRLASQADVDIVLGVARLAGHRAPPVRGSMTVRQALARLLVNLDAVAVPMRGGGWRIEPRRRARARAPARPPPRAQAPQPIAEIIVTASKQETPLRTYAGSATIIDARLAAGSPAGGSDAIVRLAATVDSTHFGPGRNKLFIRGISDSAFLGPLQATVGQYLGDVRLAYGVPDPDLELVDIASVEILEGPQATLYGSGSLGGVIRILPNVPESGRWDMLVSAGVSATAHGEPGYEGTMILNLPLEGEGALRLVGYRRSDGGYIDDVVTGRRDSNRSTTTGGRGALRVERDGWVVDLGLAAQGIRSADAGALPLGQDGLARAGGMMQPYSSRFHLVSLNLTRDWDDMKLVSATGLSRLALDQHFDSSGKGGTDLSTVSQRELAQSFSNETRLSGLTQGGTSWVAGFAATLHRGRSRYDHVSATEPERILQRVDKVSDGALFGEVTSPVTPQLRLTAGLRLSRTRLSSRAGSGETPSFNRAPLSTDYRLIPSAGLFWQATEDVGLFARYQQGFRAGGNVGLPTDVARIPPDRVYLVEAGIRAEPSSTLKLDASLARVRWHDVQANGLTLGGDLVSATIGNATIYSLGFKGDWRPDDRFSLTGGLFLNRHRLRSSGVSQVIVEKGSLPGVSRFAASFSLSYRQPLAQGWNLSAAAATRYFGRSVLGTGAVFGQRQGGYSDTELSLRLGNDRRALTLSLANPLDIRGNRLSFANPYRLFDPQFIPLRPATFRLGWEARF